MRLFKFLFRSSQPTTAVLFETANQIAATQQRKTISELPKDVFASYMFRTKNIICL